MDTALVVDDADESILETEVNQVEEENEAQVEEENEAAIIISSDISDETP